MKSALLGMLFAGGFIAVALEGPVNDLQGGRGALSFASAADGAGTWSDGPPLPVEIAEMAGASIGPVIYTGGGFTPPGGAIGTWFGRLDTSAEAPAWESLAEMPAAVHHPGMAAGDGRVWLAGGYAGGLSVSEATSGLFAYDPALNTWERKTDLPGRRGAHFLVHVDGRLYAIGGVGDRSSSMFVYDIATDEWAEAPGPTPREHLGGAASGGLVYAVAGRGFGLGDRSAILEAFDPAMGEWTRLEDMPGQCGGCTAAATADGRIHVTGGETFGAARTTYREHYVYDPTMSVWSVAADMPTARHGLASAAVGGRFYTIGGGRVAGLAYSNVVEVWAPDEGPVIRIALPFTVVRTDSSGIPVPATAVATEAPVPSPTTMSATPVPTLPIGTPSPSPSPSSPPPSPTSTASPPVSASPTTSSTTPAAATPAPDCAAVPTFDDGLEPLRELWVAPGGDDAAGDGSRGAPFRTIRRAARDATPGTAIRLTAGEHSGGHYIEDLRGTVDAPIWIGGENRVDPVEPAPDEGPASVLVGGTEALHLTRSAYVVVHDLSVRGSNGNGINADDGGAISDPAASHELVFRRIRVEDIGGDGNQDCLKLSGLSEITVDRSAFRRCGGGLSGSGIDMVGVHRAVIAQSLFESMSGNAVQAKGGSADVIIRRNTVRDGGGRAFNLGGSTGREFFRPPLDPDSPNAEARRIRVYANLIEGGDTPFAFVGCVDCLVANNTVIEPAIWLMRILQETNSGDGFEFEPARDGRVVNNIFVFRRSQIRTYVNIGGGTAPETFAFANNLWFALDDPSRSAPELPVAEVGGIVGFDPRLGVDGAIGAESPAALAGTTVDADPDDPIAALADHVGACFADPRSIGAREIDR